MQEQILHLEDYWPGDKVRVNVRPTRGENWKIGIVVTEYGLSPTCGVTVSVKGKQILIQDQNNIRIYV